MFISDLCAQLEATKTYTLPDIKEAIYKIAEAWEQVKPETIANCWRHTGITPPAVVPDGLFPEVAEQLSVDAEVEQQLECLQEGIQKLQVLDKTITETCTMEELEQELAQAYGTVVSDDAPLIEDSSESESEVELEQPPYTHSQASEATERLIRYWEQQTKCDHSDIKILRGIGKKILQLRQRSYRQKHLLDYYYCG
eukprot:Colp12_sorted_trinity150504_noHs@24122